MCMGREGRLGLESRSPGHRPTCVTWACGLGTQRSETRWRGGVKDPGHRSTDQNRQWRACIMDILSGNLQEES
jgi:hypothetical protein